MFSFKCPGCHATHFANEQFQGLRAKCLRCGEVLMVGEKQPRRVARKKTAAGGQELGDWEVVADSSSASQVATASKKKTKSPADQAAKQAEKPGDRDGQEEAERPVPQDKRKDDKRKDTDEPQDGDETEREPEPSRRKLWVAAASAMALLAAGVGIYFFILGASAPDRIGPVKESSGANKTIAKSPPVEPIRSEETKTEDEQPENPGTAPTPKAIAKNAAPAKGSAPAKKPIVATNSEPIRVSVHRIHRLERADPPAARREYDRKLLEIYGSCVRFNAAPAGLRMEFALEKEAEPFVLTVVPATLESKLRHILPGQNVTLRGVYESPGNFHDVELVRTQTAGDEMYHGKQVELIGYVGQVGVHQGDELSSLRFEPDATDRVVGVECLFKKQEGSQVEGFRSGQYVIVRGRCGVQTFNTARLHNCQIVYDYAARSEVQRMEVGRFIDDYEQDLRDAEPIEESDTAVVVGAAELLEAYKDPAKASKLYHRRRLEVDGTMEAADSPKSAVILEGGTDQGMKVKCQFSPAKFRRLKTAQRMKIQGSCSGVDGKFVRLDNCETLQPAPAPEKTGPRLDAEFHPFRPGGSLTYETAYHSGSSNRAALQQVLNFREDRIMQYVNMQTGQLKNKTGLAGGVNWTKKAAWGQPLVQHYRLHAGRVEISPTAAGAKNQPSGIWEPVLIVGAQAGDSWTWNSAGQKSVYTLVEFSEYDTRQSAMIKKTTESPKSPVIIETMLVYARGIGEVERKVYEIPAKGNKRLIMETQLAK